MLLFIQYHASVSLVFSKVRLVRHLFVGWTIICSISQLFDTATWLDFNEWSFSTDVYWFSVFFVFYTRKFPIKWWSKWRTFIESHRSFSLFCPVFFPSYTFSAINILSFKRKNHFIIFKSSQKLKHWFKSINIANFCQSAIASLPPSLHHSHLAMHHHHHHNALMPNGLAMSSNLNNNSIQTNNNNLANKVTNNHLSTNSTKNNNSNSNDTESHRHHADNKTGPLSSNNSSSNSPNHLSSRPATPGIVFVCLYFCLTFFAHRMLVDYYLCSL